MKRPLDSYIRFSVRNEFSENQSSSPEQILKQLILKHGLELTVEEYRRALAIIEAEVTKLLF